MRLLAIRFEEKVSLTCIMNLRRSALALATSFATTSFSVAKGGDWCTLMSCDLGSNVCSPRLLLHGNAILVFIKGLPVDVLGKSVSQVVLPVDLGERKVA